MKKVVIAVLLASLLGFISMEARAAFIDVTSKPAGARVKVDGKDEGSTPLLLDLTAGRYQLEVEKKGYITHRETLTVSGDGAMTVELEKEPPPKPTPAQLREQEQARKAREAEAAQKAREAEQARKEREAREEKEREQAELERQESGLARLDAEIAAMQRRIESGSSSAGDSLKQLASQVERRGELAAKIAAKRQAQAVAAAEQQRQEAEVERQRREELARVEAEKERLRQEQLAAAEAKRRNMVEGDIADYEKIVNSSGGSSLAGAAWTSLVGKYPTAAGIEQGDLAIFRQVVIEGISLAELRERERERERVAAEARQLAVLAGEFVSVAGGCYKMGDNFGDGDSDEKPVHEVCVDGFSIGKYEVTVGEFRRFVESSGYRTEAEKGDGCYVYGNGSWAKKKGKSWRDPNFPQGDKEPVVCLSWNDSQAYIEWLNRQSGKRYRLPTEAEWEYAARSGGKKEKYAGGDNLDSLAWYGSNAGSTTHPVGTKGPNGLGIYDMSGNVWEWVEDWYGDKYYGSSPRNNPTGPSSGATRVRRGGSWRNDAGDVRTANRLGNTPALRCFNLGFRLALPAGQ